MSIDLTVHEDDLVAVCQMLGCTELESEDSLVFGDDVHGNVTANGDTRFMRLRKKCTY